MAEPLNLTALLDEDREPASDATTRRILDAAYAEILSFGLRRATLEDITRRAGVGRMTLHRRFPSKQALVEAMFLDQLRNILLDVSDAMDRHEDTVRKITLGLATGIHAMTTHPLFSRLLETDPEAILPYLTTQAQPMLLASTAFIAERIGDGEAALLKAETIIRFSHSILLLPRGSFDLTEPDALQDFVFQAVQGLLRTDPEPAAS